MGEITDVQNMYFPFSGDQTIYRGASNCSGTWTHKLNGSSGFSGLFSASKCFIWNTIFPLGDLTETEQFIIGFTANLHEQGVAKQYVNSIRVLEIARLQQDCKKSSTLSFISDPEICS